MDVIRISSIFLNMGLLKIQKQL